MGYTLEDDISSEAMGSTFTRQGVKKQIVASDGVMITWVEFGSGTPLVISPALGTPLISWLHALEQLSAVYKIIFLLTRGGYEGDPSNSVGLTVERRGADLVELIETLEFQKYYIVAHSSGVAPVIVGLEKLKKAPKHVCLFSARYDIGPPINAESLIQRAKDIPGFFNILQSIVSSFSPPFLTELIREPLSDFKRIEALLYAFEYSRSYECVGNNLPNVPITFVITEDDPDDVRSSTWQMLERSHDKLWNIVDIKGVGHFFIQTHGISAAKLILEHLS